MDGSVIALRYQLAYSMHEQRQHVSIVVWIGFLDVDLLEVLVESFDCLESNDVVRLVYEELTDKLEYLSSS